MRRAFIITVVAAALLAWPAAFAAAPAQAAGPVVSWNDRQTLPGVTQRTIWGRGQVYVYRLPANVTHTGDLHVELSYAPAGSACFAYLLGPVAKGSTVWQVCPGTYGQGFLSQKPGKQVIDSAVTTVLDQDPVDDGVRGDAYYVVVQAANGVSRVRITGYAPRVTTGDTDTSADATFTRAYFARPASARATITLKGAPYGGPFDFTPTSEGPFECRLQYPADPALKAVPAATPALAASFEQYVYPPLWEPVAGQIPVSDPTDSSHWDLYDDNRHAAAPLAGDDWYGLQSGFAVQSAGPWRPGQTYHYVPVLWLAAAAPYAQSPAEPGPPATGLRTVGYKATLLVPQRLRLASASRRVRRGGRATLKGTLAMPEGGVAGARLVWAPPGTAVTIQAKLGSVWTPVKQVRTGAGGRWQARIRVRRTTNWRAIALPSAGLPLESSLVKRTVVRR